MHLFGDARMNLIVPALTRNGCLGGVAHVAEEHGAQAVLLVGVLQQLREVLGLLVVSIINGDAHIPLGQLRHSHRLGVFQCKFGGVRGVVGCVVGAS